MRHRLAAFCAALLAVCLLADAARAEGRRMALVIGNAAYAESPLRSPDNDARAVRERLRGLGFEVEGGIDLDGAAMASSARGFTAKLRDADTALFYYSGHGAEFNGENYLIPTDFGRAGGAPLALSTVLNAIEAAAGTTIVILDACRSDPAEKSLSGAATAESPLAKGFAPVTAGKGAYIAYASAPGTSALDGDEGGYSLFTRVLLDHIGTPGLKLEDLMKRVRGDVNAMTGGFQRPWTNSGMLGEFYFAPGDAPALVAPAPALNQSILVVPPSPDAEALTFDAALRVQDRQRRRDALASFLARYPNGRYAGAAQIEIDEIDVELNRAAAPPRAYEMVFCEVAGNSMWSRARLVTFQQCEGMGGSWRRTAE